MTELIRALMAFPLAFGLVVGLSTWAVGMTAFLIYDAIRDAVAGWRFQRYEVSYWRRRRR